MSQRLISTKKGKPSLRTFFKIAVLGFFFLSLGVFKMTLGLLKDIDINVITVASTCNDDDLKLAYNQSYGFFDNVPTSQWRIHQEIMSQYNPHKNSSDPLEYVPGHSKSGSHKYNAPAAFYQTNYEPNFSCGFERRVGGNGNGDGPKWVRERKNYFHF